MPTLRETSTEMEDEMNQYSADYERLTANMRETIEVQAAQIAMMREVLLLSKNGNNPAYQEMVKKVLSTTPNEALQAFAAKVREQCAQVCESTYPEYGGANPFCFETPSECADAIRNLKELPK